MFHCVVGHAVQLVHLCGNMGLLVECLPSGSIIHVYILDGLNAWVVDSHMNLLSAAGVYETDF